MQTYTLMFKHPQHKKWQATTVTGTLPHILQLARHSANRNPSTGKYGLIVGLAPSNALQNVTHITPNNSTPQPVTPCPLCWALHWHTPANAPSITRKGMARIRQAWRLNRQAVYQPNQCPPNRFTRVHNLLHALQWYYNVCPCYGTGKPN